MTANFAASLTLALHGSSLDYHLHLHLRQHHHAHSVEEAGLPSLDYPQIKIVIYAKHMRHVSNEQYIAYFSI